MLRPGPRCRAVLATAPTSEINTLANIIAPCVNSVDSGGHPSAACQQLFCVATPGGVFSGTCNVTPTIKDTLRARCSQLPAIPPATSRPCSIFAVSNSPYSPSLGSGKHNDWTMALNYVGGGLNEPFYIAIDSLGNPWITNSGNSSVSKFSPTGVALSRSGGITAGGIDNPRGMRNRPLRRRLDRQQNASLTELDVDGNALSGVGGYTGGGLGESSSIAIDPQQNVWVSGGAKLAKFCGNIPANCPMDVTTGQPISPSGGFTGGGLTIGTGMG